MRETIWVESWQLECCGDPFKVGFEVCWTVCPAAEEDLAHRLGPELARAVTGLEEHHGGENTRPVTGTVRSIRAVCLEYAPRFGEDPRMLYPVRGTTVVTEVQTANRSFTGGDLSFAGYVVDLLLEVRRVTGDMRA